MGMAKVQGDEHEGGKSHAFADTHDGSAGYQGSPEGGHRFPEALVGVTVAAPEYGKDGHPHEGYIKGALDMLLRKARDDEHDNPCHGGEESRQAGHLVHLLQEEGKQSDPKRRDQHGRVPVEEEVAPAGETDEGYSQPQGGEDNADAEETQGPGHPRPGSLADAEDGRQEAHGHHEPDRGIRGPDPAYTPRSHKADILEVLVLVPFQGHLRYPLDCEKEDENRKRKEDHLLELMDTRGHKALSPDRIALFAIANFSSGEEWCTVMILA